MNTLPPPEDSHHLATALATRPPIAQPLTSQELSRRVLELLAAMNGKAPEGTR
jgi:hypothetical protein